MVGIKKKIYFVIIDSVYFEVLSYYVVMNIFKIFSFIEYLFFIIIF